MRETIIMQRVTSQQNRHNDQRRHVTHRFAASWLQTQQRSITLQYSLSLVCVCETVLPISSRSAVMDLDRSVNEVLGARFGGGGATGKEPIRSGFEHFSTNRSPVVFYYNN